ncbi:MAG: NotI family restriction endonuclease [Candidatus Bathyarchaeia archaeon]|jgi:hypothetical protein
MKKPLEFYGIQVSKPTDWAKVLRFELCPFLNKKCVKQRKSNPQQTIGACTIGFKDDLPLIICPHRFLQHNKIFVDSVPLLAKGEKYFVLPEISMPGGNIDYFVISEVKGDIIDYLGLEIQGLDTTGSGGIWAAREDLKKGEFGDNYSYGINWKMSAKTILIQMHHKGQAFESLGKKLVLVTQKSFFDYMTREFRTRHLHEAVGEDAIQFQIYDCIQLEGCFELVLTTRKSTDVIGMEEMLKLGREPTISEEEVVRRIKAKMGSAIKLQL